MDFTPLSKLQSTPSIQTFAKNALKIREKSKVKRKIYSFLDEMLSKKFKADYFNQK